MASHRILEDIGNDDYDDDAGPDTLRGRASVITPKFTSFLSIIGSLVIIMEVLADRREKKTTGINRILLSLSVSDILFSCAMFVGTWAAPKETSDYVYGAAGNTATCTAQGFFIELGWVASPLFSMSLAFYSYLIVRHNWSEARLKSLDPWLHGTIWVVAIALAIVLIPLDLYNSSWEFCWIDNLPHGCEEDDYVDCIRGENAWIWGLVLSVFPCWLCLFVPFFFIIPIICMVREVENNNLKYSVHTATANRNRSTKVAIQFLLYMTAFYITWVPDTVSTILYYTKDHWNYWLDLVAYSIVLPLTGFLNLLVFMRPRKMKTRLGRNLRWFFCCGFARERTEQQKSGTATTYNSGHSVDDRSHS